MYNPQQFKIHSKNQLLSHIANFGFGYLVSASDGPGEYPFMTPLPMLVAENTLYGHVSRANPHWQLFDGVRVAQAIFPGPHGYVSPLWYPDPVKSVPTWNYAMARATGRPTVLSDPTDVDWLMAKLVAQYEASDGWSVDQADPTFRTQQLRGIVAFQMPIDHLDGKAKLSQNKSPAVAKIVESKFREAGNTGLADAMAQHNQAPENEA